MDRVFRLKPSLRAIRSHPDRLFLVGEDEHALLTGPVTAQLLPLVDGRRSVRELMAALRGRCTPPEVLFTLHRLADAGYITTSREDLPSALDAYWYSCGHDEAALARLRHTPVAIDIIGRVNELAEPAAEALHAAMLSTDSAAPLRLVLTDDYLRPELDDYSCQASERRSSWMLVKPVGRSPWLGPFFRPGQGPCWHCLAHRLSHNRPVETFLLAGPEPMAAPLPPLAAHPTTSLGTLQLAASLLAEWLASGAPGRLERKLWSLQIVPFGITEHVVVQRPQCPTCGDPSLVAKRLRAPVTVGSRRKRFNEDGGHRCVSPEETLARHRHQVSPISGIVTSIAPIPDRSHPLRPVFGASVMSVPTSAEPTHSDFIRHSLGKGRTMAQAEASALCEALERATMRCQGDELLVCARMAELDAPAVSPRLLQNFSDDQYRHRLALNARMADRRRFIPAPFSDEMKIAWLPSWSLTREQRCYLPAAFCYGGLPDHGGEPCCFLDGNGHAAGNCLEEAILQASFELAERDGVGIWWYNRLRRPGVDLASFRQPYFTDLIEHYAELDHRLWVLDVTNDLAIPCFVALAQSAVSGRFSIGFGAHFSPMLGIQRALTEVNQTFDVTHRLPQPWGDAALADTGFLFPDEAQPARLLGSYPCREHTDLLDDVLDFRRIVEAAGLDMIVQDQTRPDIGLHVVKVVVPGLRHIWQRLGPGRLYDVPVSLGWLGNPHTEAKMNPVPLHL